MTPRPPIALLPGMTVRFRDAGRLDAAVVASADDAVVVVVTADGRRRRLARAVVRPAGDARMRRVADRLRTDPDAAAAECREYLRAWVASRGDGGGPARRRSRPGVHDLHALCERVAAVVAAAPVPVARAEVLAACPAEEPAAIDRALRELVDQGRLRRTGRAAGTRFAVPAHALF